MPYLERRLRVEDLRQLCEDREGESLILEFKSCNELRAGTAFRDERDKGNWKTRSPDSIQFDLTKDVTALLNAAGGTIIYGIQESNSRAEKLDDENAFKPGEFAVEKIIQWIRAYTQPAPSVNVYPVSEDPTDPQAKWYLVIDVPQGEQAYMAKDKRYHRRSGNTNVIMEHHEVVDVMNRTRGASLITSIAGSIENGRFINGEGKLILELNVAVTSGNHIASEFGAVKLTTIEPLYHITTLGQLRGTTKSASMEGVEGPIETSSVMTRWGGNAGSVVFPGDWYSCAETGFRTASLGFGYSTDPVHLFEVELFTLNRLSRKILYAVERISPGETVKISEVMPGDEAILIRFHQTLQVTRRTIKAYS